MPCVTISWGQRNAIVNVPHGSVAEHELPYEPGFPLQVHLGHLSDSASVSDLASSSSSASAASATCADSTAAPQKKRQIDSETPGEEPLCATVSLLCGPSSEDDRKNVAAARAHHENKIAEIEQAQARARTEREGLDVSRSVLVYLVVCVFSCLLGR